MSDPGRPTYLTPPQGSGAPTAVVLHVVHGHVGGHKGRLAVLLLVLLFCQQAGLGILRGDDVFDLGTVGRWEEHPAPIRPPSFTRMELRGVAGSPVLPEEPTGCSSPTFLCETGLSM